MRVWTPAQRASVRELKSLIAKYEETRDIRLMGGYKQGNDPQLDRAMFIVPPLYQYLSQGPEDVRPDETIDTMLKVMLKS